MSLLNKKRERIIAFVANPTIDQEEATGFVTDLIRCIPRDELTRCFDKLLQRLPAPFTEHVYQDMFDDDLLTRTPLFVKRAAPDRDSQYQCNRFYPTFEDYFTQEDGAWEGPLPDPFQADLLQARKAFICQLTPDQIVNIDVLNEFTDDHEPCCEVEITFSNGDILSCGFMWSSLCYAFRYIDSSTAMDEIISGLFDYIKDI